MTRRSAGLLPVRHTESGIEVFLAHLGGPLWARKDERAWSLVKGEHDANEDPAAAARREWLEETSLPVPAGEWHDLGEVRQSGGKIVRGYAVLTPDPLGPIVSNEVEIEWPPRSGRRLLVPEVDRAEWMSLEQAAVRLVAAQAAFLDRLPAPM